MVDTDINATDGRYLEAAVLDFLGQVGRYRLDPPSHVTDLAPRELKVVLDRLVNRRLVTAERGIYQTVGADG